MTETDPLSGFEGQVRTALTHVHDSVHLQSHPLTRFVASTSSSNPTALGRALQEALLDAVEALRPISTAGRASHGYRTHDILRLRYAEGLEVPEILDRLALSRSMYYLELHRAIDAVSRLLWQRWRLGDAERPATLRQWPTRLSDSASPEHDTWLAEQRTRASTLANLPVSLTSFVGREREMAEVGWLLERARLLTLTGTGGCGKTRLAIESARSFLDRYPGGTWLVQLAPIVDPALVPLAVAATLGVHETAHEPIAASLAHCLETRRALLVLDNCEHLLDACARLASSLLGECPSLSILATSRQPLGIGGETVLHVPSLDSPPSEGWVTREALLQAVLSLDATRLFLDRASAALPSFAASISNSSAIAEICRRLDGIPLAIELAAARVRAFSPEQIASRLDHDFHLLAGGSRTALPRHQTLKAAFDWSHDLLSEPERMLLRRLSVFAGGFTLGAAEGVCAGEGIEEVEVANLLAELVDHSLVEVEPQEAEPRYRLLEPVRQYARHRLEEAGEEQDAMRRHAVWITALVKRDPAEVLGPGEVRWFGRLRQEQPNVRAALQWCSDNDPRMGLQLASRVWLLWMLNGHDSERRRWTDGVLELDPERTEIRAAVDLWSAADAINRGDYERARALTEESLTIFLESANIAGVCDALNLVGHAFLEQGDHDRARGIFETGAGLARGISYIGALPECLWRHGTSAWLAGDYPRSETLLAESMTVCREVGMVHHTACVKHTLGGLNCSEGNYPRARVLLEESLDVLHEYPDSRSRGIALTNLAYVHLQEGDLARAEERLSAALRLLSEIGHRPFFGRGLCILAMLASRRGQPLRVVTIAGTARAANVHYRHLLAPNERADLDSCLAEARSALGEEAFACAFADGQALTLAQAVEYALQDEAEA